jgi:transcriptional regulator with XRE-family HTH domain
MTNPLDRSLDDMRSKDDTRNKKEVDDMMIEEAELDELDQLGARLSQAYELSGEPPSLAAIEFAQSSVSLPGRAPADIARFNEGVRQRIDSALRTATGASNIGAWVQEARQDASIDEAAAARDAGVAVPAYRRFEEGRMPVWRLPARTFAEFCKELAIDIGTLLRWASVTAMGARHVAFGRLDAHDDERSDMLDTLAGESEKQSEAEFDEWRREFIAAYEEPSADDAPL